MTNFEYRDPNPNHAPIDTRQYQMFDNVFKVREALIKNNFWTQDVVDRLMTLFTQLIGVDSYQFNPMRLEITARVNKASVAQMPNYRAESMFYYNAMGQSMLVLLQENKEKVIDSISKYFPPCNVYDLYFSIIVDAVYMYNLTNVQLIADDIIQIIL